MVRLVLRAMKAEGIIQPTEKGRAAAWQRTSRNAPLQCIRFIKLSNQNSVEFSFRPSSGLAGKSGIM